MTIEEAIKEIKDASDSEVRYGDKDNHYDKVMKRIEAFGMAIKVLEQQPNRCDSCTHSEEQDGSNCYECVKGMADNFKTQPTDADCISRQKLLSRIDAERKHLLDIKMDGAEHIIVHHARRIIEDMPSITPSIPDSENDFDLGYNSGYADAMFDIAEGE